MPMTTPVTTPEFGVPRTLRSNQGAIVDWLVPTAIALAILGPALRPGVIFNLDLILTPHLDTPTGFWGLGPELPRRLPLWVPISWLSSVVPATVTGKALMLILLVLPWVGMARLTRLLSIASAPAGRLACNSAGALYALSPFILTRTAVGHFNVTVPHAVLPWVLPVLVRPGRRLSTTFLACFAMGFAGHSGGTLAVAIVCVVLLCGRRQRWLGVVAVAVAAQAPWVVPGLAVVAANPIHMATGDKFPTSAVGVAGLARLSAGGGFWNTYFQIGGSGAVVAISGVALLAMAVVGNRLIDPEFRVPLLVLGSLGWFVAAASAINGLDTVWFWINDHLLGGVWREGHRVLTLHLVWLAPAAALGSQRLYRALVARPRWTFGAGPAVVLPAAIATLLAVPGLWGLGGQVSADPLPAGWQQSRQAIEADPGTVLALPWYQYFNLSIGNGPVRRVLNPLPLYLGGDVLSSSDNGLQREVREYGDPRETPADALVARLVDHQAIAHDLSNLGVRWVMLLKTIPVAKYDALSSDPGLRTIVDTPEVALYEVAAWRGEAVDDAGRPVSVSDVGPAFATLEESAAVTWARGGSDGWRRGMEPGTITASGLVRLPSGTGLVWNVATVPALAGQVLPTIGVVVVLERARRHRRRRRAARPSSNLDPALTSDDTIAT